MDKATLFPKKIVQKNITKLLTTSPHLFNVEPTVTEKLDDSRCDIIEIGFNNSNKKTYRASELYKKSVTVEYVVSDDTMESYEFLDFDASSIFNLPPYVLGQALSVAPVIKIDGQAVLTGPAIDFDEKQKLYINSKTVGKIETYEEELSPGELCCIVFDVGTISPNELSEAYSKSINQTAAVNNSYQLNESTKASKVDETNVYNTNYLGSILHLTGIMYFSQLDIYTQTLAEKKNVNCEDTVKIGVFGFKPGVYPSKVRVADEPYGIDKNGQFIVDILSNAVSTVSEVSNSEQLRAFNMERGYISSELESAILEQIVGVESLSTVQLFKRAQEKGIKIVSLSKNTTKKVSDLKISDEDAKRLQAEIDAGNTIITMEQSITVGKWTGIGYIVETADQASQAFMISGKTNGGVCSSSVSVAAIIGIAIDEIWLVETVGLFIATLSAMTSLAFVPVATLVLCVIAIELMVFDIIETIANNYDYYMNGNEEAGTQVKINAAINVITFGVTKIGGAIISQAKNATNCAKYGKNVITGLKNTGFTTAEVNAQISKFSKLGCSQSTIDTLLKNPKCMFLGDDVLKVIGETGGSQRLLAEFVLRNGDDVAKGVVNLANKEGTIGIVNLFDEFGKASQNLAKYGVTDSTIINKLQVDYVLAKSSSKIITEPVSKSSTTLRGIAGTPDPNDPRPIERQNEAAHLFADKGFDVEMLPDSPNGNGYGLLDDSCPDYLINGQAFDCYSPDKNTSVRNIWSTVKGKTETQARRIVINFDDSNKTLTELIKQFHTWDISTLDELFVVKDGEIIRVILK